MIWPAYRLNRTPLLLSLGFIAVLIVTTVTAGFYVADYPAWTWSFGGFCSRWNDAGPCRPETALTLVTLFALLLPLLLGVFVGAPVFARELDSRTHVVGFTQSSTRARWYFARVVAVYLPISLAMMCLGIALHWATESSRDSAGLNGERAVSFSWFDFPHFETAGVVLGAYTLLMLLIGGALTLTFRNGTMAMFGTLVVFLVVPVGFTWFAREHYGTPTLEIEAIDGLYRESEYAPNPYFTTDGTWVVGAGYVDARGDNTGPDTEICRPKHQDDYTDKRGGEADQQQAERIRVDDRTRAEQYDNCLRDQGVGGFGIYSYSEDQFWRFQTIESGLMLGFGIAAGALGMSRVRRLT